mgnify:CR=1 FL=1
MKNFSVMNMLDCQCHLNEPIQKQIFRDQLSNFLLVLDLFVHVASICVVHNDAEELLIHERLSVSDNVGVSHCLQNSNFVQGILLLFLLHIANIDNLSKTDLLS